MKDIMKNYHTFDELIKLINASGKAYNIELIKIDSQNKKIKL